MKTILRSGVRKVEGVWGKISCSIVWWRRIRTARNQNSELFNPKWVVSLSTSPVLEQCLQSLRSLFHSLQSPEGPEGKEASKVTKQEVNVSTVFECCVQVCVCVLWFFFFFVLRECVCVWVRIDAWQVNEQGTCSRHQAEQLKISPQRYNWYLSASLSLSVIVSLSLSHWSSLAPVAHQKVGETVSGEFRSPLPVFTSVTVLFFLSLPSPLVPPQPRGDSKVSCYQDSESSLWVWSRQHQTR